MSKKDKKDKSNKGKKSATIKAPTGQLVGGIKPIKTVVKKSQ